MRDGLAFISFSEGGAELAKTLAAQLGGSAQRAGNGICLTDWTAENFPAREGLVFVGAAGIAVRAIAAFLKGKAEDPAVVCVREDGRFAVPLLSGHLGGANALAERIAALTGGIAVITTATDVRRIFAVDLWAKKQGLCVLQPERIREISAKLLSGKSITVSSPWPIAGSLPENVATGEEGEVRISWRAADCGTLRLVPRVLFLGIGCRRGTTAQTMDSVFRRFCGERGILPQAVCAAASIDVKQDEEGLLAFCGQHGWPIRFYSAEELSGARGEFSASVFVRKQVGVDNVCERAAVLRSAGFLAEKKYAAEGVTFAIAEAPPQLDWSW